MLAFHGRSSNAEMHENYAHLFHVLAGAATLIVGGKLVRPRTVAPGETHADSIDAGDRQELRPGDLAHIPAGVPHQFLLAGDKTLACIVVKIQQPG